MMVDLFLACLLKLPRPSKHVNKEPASNYFRAMNSLSRVLMCHDDVNFPVTHTIKLLKHETMGFNILLK